MWLREAARSVRLAGAAAAAVSGGSPIDPMSGRGRG